MIRTVLMYPILIRPVSMYPFLVRPVLFYPSSIRPAVTLYHIRSVLFHLSGFSLLFELYPAF